MRRWRLETRALTLRQRDRNEYLPDGSKNPDWKMPSSIKHAEFNRHGASRRLHLPGGLSGFESNMILAGDDHYGTLLSVAEAQTQLSIWSIMASPLIMSSDLRTLKAEYKAVLLNKEMIKINQDTLGKAGVRVGTMSPTGDKEVWVRELAGGDIAVALYNRAETARAFMSTKLSSLGLQIPADAKYKVTDVWNAAEDKPHAESREHP